MEKFRTNRDRRNRAKSHVWASIASDFGILLGLLASDPKFFPARAFCATFSKKVAKKLKNPDHVFYCDQGYPPVACPVGIKLILIMRYNRISSVSPFSCLGVSALEFSRNKFLRGKTGPPAAWEYFTPLLAPSLVHAHRWQASHFWPWIRVRPGRLRTVIWPPLFSPLAANVFSLDP